MVAERLPYLLTAVAPRDLGPLLLGMVARDGQRFAVMCLDEASQGVPQGLVDLTRSTELLKLRRTHHPDNLDLGLGHRPPLQQSWS